VLKDLLGGTIKEMMEAEMDDHLGYEKSERTNDDSEDRICNCYWSMKGVRYENYCIKRKPEKRREYC
jgi:transposase-like protein